MPVCILKKFVCMVVVDFALVGRARVVCVCYYSKLLPLLEELRLTYTYRDQLNVCDWLLLINCAQKFVTKQQPITETTTGFAHSLEFF